MIAATIAGAGRRPSKTITKPTADDAAA